jgi:hypothetical protein
LQISFLPSKPEHLPDLANTYQYFEITIDLEEDEIKQATVKFEVPRAWLEDNNYLKETVKLNVFAEKWAKLPTEIFEEFEDTIIFKSELKHFSYFAITASSELDLAWYKQIIPPKLGTKEFILFGIIITIAFLLILYWFVREREVY